MDLLWNWWKKLARKEADYQPFIDASIQPKEKFTLKRFREELNDVADLVVQPLHGVDGRRIVLLYLKTMVNVTVIQETILNPLLWEKQSPEKFYSLFKPVEKNELGPSIQQVLVGNTLIVIDDEVFSVNTFSAPLREIEKSDNETTVYGPQEAFSESAEINLSMIRRRVHSKYLKTQLKLIGTESQSSIYIMYMDNLVNQDVLDKVIKRIEQTRLSHFAGSSTLRNVLEDNTVSPFAQLNVTGRVDNTTQALLDGRVVILHDGSPNALICPVTFFENFVTTDDYYVSWLYATFTRGIRFFGFFISIMISAVYVSITTYHPVVLPEELLYVLTVSRNELAVRPYMEALLMELLIDVLREAGLRMPTKIGQTIGIVGGIVIGTAAVQAGLVSNILVVIVAIGTLLSYTVPNFFMSHTTRLLRYLFIVAAGFYGFLGISLVFAVLMIHLLGLKSFGHTYTTPIIPRKWTDLSDGLLRAPLEYLTNRSGIGKAKKKLVRPLDEK